MPRQEDGFSGDPFEVEITPLPPDGEEDTPLQHSRGARFWRLALAGGAVALAATLLVGSFFPNVLLHLFTTPPPTPLVLRPQEQGLTCLDDVAWAPAGGQVALLGFHGPCENAGGYFPGLVLIYDATTGAVAARLQPDDAILAALQDSRVQLVRAGGVAPVSQPAGARLQLPQIGYQHVLWSPDGKRLALTFIVWLAPDASTRLDGVALLDATGKQEQVFFQPVPVVGPFFEEWNLEQGTPVEVTPGLLLFGPLFETTMPLSQSYRWGQAGGLEPQLPISGRPPADDPIGTPDGGAAFTPWQPGVVQVADVGPGVPTPATTAIYTWNTRFAAWSPHGRYLLDWLALAARLTDRQISTTAPQTLAMLHLEQLPTLPVRDAALLRLLQERAWQDQGNLAVAWRPDGKELAALPLRGQNIALVNTASGTAQPSLTFPKSPLAYLTSTPLLRWSPEGTRLLAVDTLAGMVLLWGPGLLP
jgi:hypothetical protein